MRAGGRRHAKPCAAMLSGLRIASLTPVLRATTTDPNRRYCLNAKDSHRPMIQPTNVSIDIKPDLVSSKQEAEPLKVILSRRQSRLEPPLLLGSSKAMIEIIRTATAQPRCERSTCV